MRVISQDGTIAITYLHQAELSWQSIQVTKKQRKPWKCCMKCIKK